MYLDLYLVPCAVNWRESESFFLYLSSPSSSSSSHLHFVSKAKTENQGPTTSSSSPAQLQLRSIRKISNRTHRSPFYPRSTICQAGNYSCARDYGNSSSSSSANPNSYQYPSASGSIHNSTPKSERYQNDGNGGSPYTSASGYRTCSGYGKK
ncbi:hypothetical protein CTAM01_08837 [Colletotrichum tamarilloi]|uniref:Uncharacterized protein n=1 Tax=Colletotrichum tamarilloi TaxID=1209934 RepID=A0ABQ9R590_9PEZI|nr:uncharacterized protein CTAM01_08837 [Colletotrichum tamarilloi]KAK1494824.1 hypothetical protein CTAM01_08837 [Colletotrichum tamarilloi]